MSADGGEDCVLVLQARADLRGAAGDELAAALQRECAALRLRGTADVADDGVRAALRGERAALLRLHHVVEALPQLQRGGQAPVLFQARAEGEGYVLRYMS